jgi:hypothetical protein
MPVWDSTDTVIGCDDNNGNNGRPWMEVVMIKRYHIDSYDYMLAEVNNGETWADHLDLVVMCKDHEAEIKRKDTEKPDN